MPPKLRELLKRAILNPGEAVEITREEEKELLEITAFLEQHPQITGRRVLLRVVVRLRLR